MKEKKIEKKENGNKKKRKAGKKLNQKNRKKNRNQKTENRETAKPLSRPAITSTSASSLFSTCLSQEQKSETISAIIRVLAFSTNSLLLNFLVFSLFFISFMHIIYRCLLYITLAFCIHIIILTVNQFFFLSFSFFTCFFIINICCASFLNVLNIFILFCMGSLNTSLFSNIPNKEIFISFSFPLPS